MRSIVATALIIDHDEPRMIHCANLLRAGGMRVRIAATATAALAALQKGVDVVLAGLILRESSAVELLREIRTHDEQLPVIFVSSWPDFARDSPDRRPADSLRGTVLCAASGYRRIRGFAPQG
jgi:DNA-binding NtrC family response regulator